jgi:hypothetical protein
LPSGADGRLCLRKQLDRVALAISAVTLAFALYSGVRFALQGDVKHLLVRMVDDSSYYLTIARNLAEGNGLTFDGIHSTNGFQPMWLLVLVPVFLVHGTPETMIRLVALLQTMLLSLAYLVFWSTQTKIFSQRTAALTGILFVGFVFPPCLNGMESALLILLATVLYRYGLHLSRAPLDGRRAAVFGLVLGCILLTRLDNIFLALWLFIWFARQCLRIEPRHRGLAPLLIGAFAASAVAVPWLAFNLVEFGRIMPISGALKSSFPHSALGPYTLPRLVALGTVNQISALLAICWSLWTMIQALLHRRPALKPEIHTAATTILAWAITTHFFYTFIFMKTDTFGWYFVLYPLFTIILMSNPIDLLLRSNFVQSRCALYPATAGLLLAVVILRDQMRDPFPQNGGWHTAVYNAALWARQHTPPTAIFAMTDCGHFAFFSLRRVINLDGLANNFDFQYVLAEHRLNQYLHDNEVDFLVQHAVHGRDDVIAGNYDSLTLPFASRLFEGKGDSVTVSKRVEVYRSGRFVDGRYPGVLAIWSLRGD